MFSGQRTDGEGSAHLYAGEHQGFDGASEDTVPQHLRPDHYVEEGDGDTYDEKLAYYYEHAEGMVYSMIGWHAVACLHLSEEAWQAHDLERAQLESMRIHETQPSYSQLYSQEDPKQCGKRLLFVCTCAFS